MTWNGYEPLSEEEFSSLATYVDEHKYPNVYLAADANEELIGRLLATIHEMRERRCGNCAHMVEADGDLCYSFNGNDARTMPLEFNLGCWKAKP